MLTLMVPSQIHFSLKALVADVADERFEACVLATVGDQVRALTERFTTHLTFMGLFTGVNVRVFLHVRFLVEPLPAELTGVRPGVRVNEQVSGQSGRAFEGLTTHFTLKAFLLRVNVHVLL